MVDDRDLQGSNPDGAERGAAPDTGDESGANVRGRVIGLQVPRAPRRRAGRGRTLWWDEEVTHQRDRDADWMKKTDVLVKTPLGGLGAAGPVEDDIAPPEPNDAETDEPLAFDDRTGPMTAFDGGLRLAPKNLDLDEVSFVSAVMVPPDTGERVSGDEAPDSRPPLTFHDQTVVGYIDPVTASGSRSTASDVARVLREVSEELAEAEAPVFGGYEGTVVMDRPEREVPGPRPASPPPAPPDAPPALVVPTPAPLPPGIAASTAPPTVAEPPPSIPLHRASWAGRLALVAMLVLVLGGGAYLAYQAYWAQGGLVVRLKHTDGSPVQKAEVFIDGRKVCDTDPCRLSELRTGSRTVRVIAPGVAPQVKVVQVHRDRATKIWVELPLLPAELTVRGAADVTVTIDGEDFGQLPLTVNLPAGRHDVSLSAPGRITLRKVVELEAGGAFDLGRVDVPSVPPHLKVELATPGAHVVLIPRHQADKIVMSGPFPKQLELPPGSYDLVASKVHYRTFHRRIDTTIEPQLSVVVKLEPFPAGPVEKHPSAAIEPSKKAQSGTNASKTERENPGVDDDPVESNPY